ncbi:MAG: signal peptide peptidase SppA [Candidatus Sumerlaeaceae bacterium]|nr:signal peptide peptidase SppA [Candidatus Sumerlaeaceae bacterium]
MLVRCITAIILIVSTSAFAATSKPESGRKAANAKIAATSTAADKTTDTEKQKAAAAKTADASSTISVEIAKADAKPAAGPKNLALEVRITGQIKERGDNVVLFGEKSKSLKDFLDVLRRARDDKDVKTIIVRLTGSELGLGMAQELRTAIREARDKGKKTIGIIEDDSQISYLVATACDQVVLPPSGDLMLYGAKAEAYFLRGLLEKVGVTAHIVHIGKYKSYGEMFTEDDYTSPARENITQIVDDIFEQMILTISESRKVTREEAEALINRGPANPQQALDSKLIDRIAYADEIYAELKKAGQKITDSGDYNKDSRSGGDDISLFGLLSMMNKMDRSPTPASSATSKFPQVAVVYAVGPISLGSSGRGGLGLQNSEEIASEDFIEILDEVQKDDKIKAVIIRVDSPGGSAFASDLIWKKIVALRKEKPVVASMGDVAASGGYYIAMAASYIVAEPGTLTGSIGVVGGKMDLAGTFEKLGVKKSTVSRGQFAGLFSETGGFKPEERHVIETMMRRTYDEFITKAAEGRRKTKDEIDNVAQGKVWLGQRAKEVGLVDDVGGLTRAITQTKLLLGMKPEDKVALVAYPKDMSFFEVLQKAVGGTVTSQLNIGDIAAPLPGELRSLLGLARQFARLFERERVLTVLPFVPRIN